MSILQVRTEGCTAVLLSYYKYCYRPALFICTVVLLLYYAVDLIISCLDVPVDPYVAVIYRLMANFCPASAANTPIASAKRPKRRAQQPLSTPVRQAELGPDKSVQAKGEGSKEGSCESESNDGVTAAGGEGLTTGDGRCRELLLPPTSPSPPKAHKSSASSTPRSTGIVMDSGRDTASSASSSSEDKADSNRHKSKESCIFSPALRPEQHGRQPEPISSLTSRDETPSGIEQEKQPNMTVEGTEGMTVEGIEGVEAKSAAPEAGLETGVKVNKGEGSEGEAVQREVQVQGEKEGGEEVKGGDLPAESKGKEVGVDVDGVEEEHQKQQQEQQQQQPEEEGAEEEEFNPYCFIAHLPPYNTVKHHTPEAPALPEKRTTRHGKELTLVLDLDETLVHCTVDPIKNPDHRFQVHFNGEEFQVLSYRLAVHLSFFCVYFSVSPFILFISLKRCFRPTMIFAVARAVDVKYRLYRDACMTLEGNYLKDLNVLGRDLSKVAIVDSSPYAYGFQIDNGIPIESWFDDNADEELLHLLPLLKQLIHESEIAGGDVRPFIRNIFKTHELVDKARNGTRDIASSSQLP
ncbi:unnamed protein product, partial [Ascophyllum nodosum]